MAMLVSAMSMLAFAAEPSVAFTVTPDKTSAYVGDSVTYTVTVKATGKVSAMQFTLDIPDGMTLSSGSVASGLKELLDVEDPDYGSTIGDVSFTKGSKMYYLNTANLDGFNPDNFVNQTVTIGSFVCTVDAANATGYTVGLNFDVVDDENLESYLPDRVSVETGTVVAKVPPCAEHTWDDGTGSPATCTQDGAMTYTCTVCGETKNETIPATGHTGGTATCKDKAVCSTCGESYGELSAEHTPGDAATCTTAQTCTVCSKELQAALGHTKEGGHWFAGADSHGYICGRCDKAMMETVGAHTGGTATCKDKAVCSICENPYGDLAEHTPGAAATCTTAQTCTVCNIELAGKDATNHVGGGSVKYDETDHWGVCACGATLDKAAHSGGTATCKDKAVCSTCGQSYGELSTEHTPGAAATCTTAQTCTVCSIELKAALGHTMTKTEAVDADCTNDGNIAYWTCGTCGKLYADDKGETEITAADTVIEATGHDWNEGEVTTEPGCETKGVKTYTCKNDETHTQTEDIEALGHAWDSTDCTVEKHCTREGCDGTQAAGEHDYAAATCTEPKTCKVCGATEGEALGHAWTPATCTEPKTCAACGETEGEALGHVDANNDYKCDECDKAVGTPPAAAPSAPAETTSPKTSDDSMILVWSVLALLGCTGSVVLLRKKKDLF